VEQTVGGRSICATIRLATTTPPGARNAALLERVRAVRAVETASYSKGGVFLGSRTTGRVNIEGYTAEERHGGS
jgi:hypothetical protein